MDLKLFLPVLLAAVAAMVIGFLWYSPMLFATPWMRAMGHDPNDKAKIAEMQKGAGKLYLASFFATIIMASVLFVLVQVIGIKSALYGAQLGFWAWAGFVAPVQFTDAIFGKRGRVLLFINSGYQLVSLLAMGAIIGGWQ
jgi:hypothetical protein